MYFQLETNNTGKAVKRNHVLNTEVQDVRAMTAHPSVCFLRHVRSIFSRSFLHIVHFAAPFFSTS